MRNSMRRINWHTGVALDHRVLNLDGTTHGVHNATKLDESPVACALKELAPDGGE